MSEAAAAKPEKADAKAAEAKPKKDILSLIVLFLVAINVATVGILGYYLQVLWEKMGDLKTETQKFLSESKKDPTESLGKELEPTQMGSLYPLESFLVNITSDQGPRFLQTTMELELADPSVEEEVSRKKAIIRDAVIVLLSSRPYSELRQASGLKRLRVDMLKTINNLLSTGKVKEIYFTQFHFN